MADKWHEAHLEKVLPEEILKAAEGLKEANLQIANAFSIIRETLQLAAALAALASQDPIEVILREALAQIEALIDGVLEGTTAHAIMIPIQKQFEGLGDLFEPNSVDPTTVDTSFDKLAVEGSTTQAILQDVTPDSINFVNTSASATGGNLGFWRVLSASLQDPGDFARPDFPKDFAVTGAVVVFGSESLADIYKIIALLNRFIQMGLRSDMGARNQPIPTGLRARIMPIPTEGRIGVQLDWTPVPPALIRPLFSGDVAVITEIFVIRSTDSALRQNFSWGSVFPDEPSDNRRELPSTTTTKVLARIKNDGFAARYVDTDKDLKIGTPYYYALSLRYKINDVFMPMSTLSNAVRVYYNARPGSTQLSSPPDWFATPSLVQLFPILQSLSSKMKLFLEGLLTRTASNNGVVNMIEQTIAQINRILLQAEELSDVLVELEALIRQLSEANPGGIYTTTFNVPTGGMSAWMGRLASRMSDPTDTSRPPFDRGTELTAGFVLVAGAPNLPSLSGFALLLDLIMGSGADNPFKVALDSLVGPGLIDTTISFDQGLQPTRAVDTSDAAVVTAATSEPDAPKPVFDANMQPAATIADC